LRAPTDTAVSYTARRSTGVACAGNARPAEAEHRLRALDELAQHLLGGEEIGDHAVAQRAHQLHAFRGAPDQRFRLAADGHELARAAVRAHGDGRRLIDDDATPGHVHQRVHRAEVDRNIVRERASHALQHHRLTNSGGTRPL
jgi:hypothetical protein